jgi:catechol 2,3-dioxygenase-like lactoylglutathione lyase family enzyme
VPEIIGIDHIYIAVSDLRASEKFYDRVMNVFGFRKNAFELGGDPHIQYFNRHFGLVIRPACGDGQHNPYAPGLHHLCLRVDSAEDVAEAASALREAGILATEPALYTQYGPDYRATFFVDPDGVRLEITNYREERRARHDRWVDL